jgi:hypothetical protein
MENYLPNKGATDDMAERGTNYSDLQAERRAGPSAGRNPRPGRRKPGAACRDEAPWKLPADSQVGLPQTASSVTERWRPADGRVPGALDRGRD